MAVNKVNVIIGATSGLGWYLARSLFNAGHCVVAFGRRQSRLQGLRALICATKEQNNRLVTFEGDVTDRTCVSELFSMTIKKFGTIHRIAICSGHYSHTTIETPVEVWRHVMETNFWGVVHVLSELKGKIKNGDIKNKVTCLTITSSLADHCVAGSGAYSCSKSALQRYIDALSLDQEVRPSEWLVYSIQPPPFRSEMNRLANISAEAMAKSVIGNFSNEVEKWHGKVVKLSESEGRCKMESTCES